MDVLDIVYKTVNVVGTMALIALVWKIGSRVGGIEQWIKTTDKEVSSHGSMLQQLTAKVSEIFGWIRGKSDDSKKE